MLLFISVNLQGSDSSSPNSEGGEEHWHKPSKIQDCGGKKSLEQPLASDLLTDLALEPSEKCPKIDIITDPKKPDLYSIGIMLCPTFPQEARTQWRETIQSIYDRNRLDLRYVDENKFWEVPHITLCIIKRVKFDDIQKFESIFQLVSEASVLFKASFFEFMGRGDMLVARPDDRTSELTKDLNAIIVGDINENDLFKTKGKTYPIDQHTKKDRFKL